MINKRIMSLTICAAITSVISSCFGIFYTFGGEIKTVTNIYGQFVTLFGDGIYANDSIMKAGATKGTDIVIILTALFLLCGVLFLRHKRYILFLQSGLLSISLYSSTCLVMGVSYNKLFLLYILQFGSTLFAFILSISVLIKQKSFDKTIYTKKMTVTAVFLLIVGCFTLIWMSFILPTIITGQPMESIEIYTTEPAFVIDLAIILPSALYCGIGLLNKKEMAYQLTPVFLTLLSGVGICVIFQTIMQSAIGMVLNPKQFVGMVISFIILGIIALVLNIGLLRLTSVGKQVESYID